MRIYRFSIAALGLLTATAMLAACSGASTTPAAPNNGAPSARHAPRPSSSGEHLTYSFTGGADGGNAATGLVLDAAGNVYGTAVVGGKDSCGVVFKLAPKGKSWQESVL